MGKRLLLIDGDGLVYRCGFAVEKTKYLVTFEGSLTEPQMKEFPSHKEACDFMDDKDVLGYNERLWSRKEIEPVEHALALIKTVLEKIKSRYPDADCQIYLTPPVGNFRDQIATVAKYKGNRDAAARPKHFKDLAAYLKDQHDAITAAGEEADDTISIVANREGHRSIIVSLDKDLDQIPGLHYNWVKEEEYTIGKKEGAINLYCQVLAGDTTDNIPGIEGIGPQKARKMLEACSSIYDCWEVVRGAYRDKYGSSGEANGIGWESRATKVPVPEEPLPPWEARAIEMARLVYLRRKEGEIWSPPKGENI